MTPTARSLAELRKRGYIAEVVERFNSHTNTRHDLFNFVDIIALKGPETLAVQATSRANMAARVDKIANAEHVGAVREAGWRICVWGWGRMASGRWELREVDVS